MEEHLKTRFSTGRSELDDAVDSLIALTGPPDPEDHLIRAIIITALKMKLEDCETLDLKIASMALKEMRYAFKVFKEYENTRKVTVFGSARIGEDTPEYRLAREFSEKMAAHGFMIITGAGGGIMQAANEGAGRALSFGLNIRLPFEQAANRVIADDHKLITFKYFFTRKLMFVKEADAIVLFPGGFGTFDECMETLALVQTGRSTPLPVVMMDVPGESFWKNFLQYVKANLVAHSYISPQDINHLFHTDSADEACRHIMSFYRNYHSMRVAGRKMLLRLTVKPDSQWLEKINTDFRDILAEGDFVIKKPLDEESAEVHLQHLPRLVFSFDGKSFGRLRSLIDAINECPGEKIDLPRTERPLHLE
ncbi:MAG: TIGR00730 family Rossman fold protein [Candidatus Eremiobacteraeota bacterium]|nr:TIGR00730 family Rossman fold protein [Candidatus Eremiobacteraeota bacterium]